MKSVRLLAAPRRLDLDDYDWDSPEAVGGARTFFSQVQHTEGFERHAHLQRPGLARVEGWTSEHLSRKRLIHISIFPYIKADCLTAFVTEVTRIGRYRWGIEVVTEADQASFVRACFDIHADDLTRLNNQFSVCLTESKLRRKKP